MLPYEIKIMEDIKKRIETALDKIRPYLIADGGNIELVEVTEDMVVKVRLTGACNGCPFSIQTMKAGVEMAVKNDVPEVKEVLDINTL